MYIETSIPQKLNDKARLIMPKKYRNAKCLNFYYHMWGDDIGSLNILTINDNGTRSDPVWKRNKDYGDEWFLAEVPLTSPDNYQIAFEGVVGKSPYGDIAIDDVKVEDRQCPRSGFCDFETTPRLCTWYNIESMSFLINLLRKRRNNLFKI